MKIYFIRAFAVLMVFALVATQFMGQPFATDRFPAGISDNNKADLPKGVVADPPQGGYYQIALGITDASLGTLLFKNRNMGKSGDSMKMWDDLIDREKAQRARYEAAVNRPVTRAELDQAIQVQQAKISELKTLKLNKVKTVTEMNIKEAEDALQDLRKIRVVENPTQATKDAIKAYQKAVDEMKLEKKSMIEFEAKQLEATGADLAKARGEGLMAAAAKASRKGLVIKSIAVVGTAVFFADAIDRIYKWTSVDENPHLFPLGADGLKIAKSSWKRVKKVFGSDDEQGGVDGVPENKSESGYLEEFGKEHGLNDGQPAGAGVEHGSQASKPEADGEMIMPAPTPQDMGVSTNSSN